VQGLFEVAILSGRGLAACFLSSLQKATKHAIGKVDVPLWFYMAKKGKSCLVFIGHD
jgi:hypothetical protein